MAIPIGEKLAAILGIEGYLQGRPVRVTLAQADAADRLSSRIRRELRAFLTGDLERAPSPPAFDFRKVSRLLTDADPDRLGSLEDESAAVVAMGFAPVLRRLVSVLPRRSMRGLLSIKPLPPSDAEVVAFRRAWQIAEDPLSILAALRAGAVSRDQAQHLEAMYPGIYTEIRQALFEVLAALKGSRPGFDLPSRKDAALQALLQTRVWNAALASDLQQAFAQEPEGEPPRRKGPDLAEAQALPTRRIEAR